MPPLGFVAVADVHLTRNCELVTSAIRLMPSSVVTPSNVVALSPKNVGVGQAVAPGDPRITVHQRLWDLIGVLLNEWDSTLTWSYDYSSVFGVTFQDAYYAHQESGPPGGWYLKGNSDNVWSGCNGCSYIQMLGEGNFGYIGAFDYSGNLYNNIYDNFVTGYSDGTYSWTASWWWKQGFPGWHMQVWCC